MGTNSTPAMIYGLALWLTVREGVKNLYTSNPVTGVDISVEELFDTVTSLHLKLVLAALNGESPEALQKIYDEGMEFVNTLTTKL